MFEQQIYNLESKIPVFFRGAWDSRHGLMPIPKRVTGKKAWKKRGKVPNKQGMVIDMGRLEGVKKILLDCSGDCAKLSELLHGPVNGTGSHSELCTQIVDVYVSMDKVVSLIDLQGIVKYNLKLKNKKQGENNVE